MVAVREDAPYEMEDRAVEGSVAFHGVHAARGNAMRGDDDGEFSDGVADALPLQDASGVRARIRKRPEC